MTIFSYNANEVLTCTIQRGLPELYQVTGFKDLDRKIIKAKVEDYQLSAGLND